MRTLTDIQLEQIAIEHYLFNLGYSVEKVSEIFDMSENTVRKIYDDYKAAFLQGANK